MGKMKDIYTEKQETLYEEYLESQRNELREEGAKEAYLMIKHDLETKLKASLIFYQPHDARPTAFREALEIVEKYL
jgi:hypothetical protein